MKQDLKEERGRRGGQLVSSTKDESEERERERAHELISRDAPQATGPTTGCEEGESAETGAAGGEVGAEVGAVAVGEGGFRERLLRSLSSKGSPMSIERNKIERLASY